MRESPAFTLTRRIEFAETDMAGIVHFSNYARMMEATEHAFFRSLGFSIHGQEMDGARIGWPRVKSSAEFFAPLRFEDEVTINLFIEELRTRSATYRFEFSTPQTARVAEGRITAVCVALGHDKGTMKATAIPTALLEKLRAAVEGQSAGTSPKDSEESA